MTTGHAAQLQAPKEGVHFYPGDVPPHENHGLGGSWRYPSVAYVQTNMETGWFGTIWNQENFAHDFPETVGNEFYHISSSQVTLTHSLHDFSEG